MKSLLLTGLLFVVLTASCLASVDHFIDGPDSQSYQVLQNATVTKEFTFLGTVNASYFYEAPDDNVITRIVADNSFENGATVYVAGGGVGRRYVVLKFESAVNRGFNYTVVVYGRGTPIFKE